MQILPNVFLSSGFAYGQRQNSYVLKLGDELILIDSGEFEVDTFPQIKENLGRWGLHLDSASHLLLTHAHFDHASHAARLQKMGVQVVGNQDCAEALASGDNRCAGYHFHRSMERCEVDRIVKSNDVIEIGGKSIRCIEAPGHANSCVIYEVVLDGRTVWFGGDVILMGPECQSVELGWSGGPDYSRAAYLETLEKLIRLDVDSLMPGHGPPCLLDARRRVEMAYAKAMLELR